MKLTAQDQQAIARRGNWYFDCYFGMTHDDSVVFTGDGVDDLDALIVRLQGAFVFGGTNVGSRFSVDTGAQYPAPKPFDIEDVQAIRGYFIQYYGNVNKPPVLERKDLTGGTAGIAL